MQSTNFRKQFLKPKGTVNGEPDKTIWKYYSYGVSERDFNRDSGGTQELQAIG